MSYAVDLRSTSNCYNIRNAPVKAFISGIHSDKPVHMCVIAFTEAAKVLLHHRTDQEGRNVLTVPSRELYSSIDDLERLEFSKSSNSVNVSRAVDNLLNETAGLSVKDVSIMRVIQRDDVGIMTPERQTMIVAVRFYTPLEPQVISAVEAGTRKLSEEVWKKANDVRKSTRWTDVAALVENIKRTKDGNPLLSEELYPFFVAPSASWNGGLNINCATAIALDAIADTNLLPLKNYKQAPIVTDKEIKQAATTLSKRYKEALNRQYNSALRA